MRGVAPLMSSASDEWSTPIDFFQAVERLLGIAFDLDAAATPQNALAPTWLDQSIDALRVSWGDDVGEDRRIWLNPPYSQIGRFMDKACAEAATPGRLIACLVPARTDTQWWHLATAAADVYLVKGRLRFGAGTGSAPFPSALVVLGRRQARPSIINWDWKRQA